MKTNISTLDDYIASHQLSNEDIVKKELSDTLLTTEIIIKTESDHSLSLDKLDLLDQSSSIQETFADLPKTCENLNLNIPQLIKKEFIEDDIDPTISANTNESKSALEVLTRTDGRNPYAYKCTYCSFSSALKKYLTDHMRREHADKYLCCNLCSTLFSSKRYLLIHKRTFHEKKKKLQCPHCSFTTLHKSSLKTHIAYHSGQPSQQLCYICGFQNNCEATMNRHIDSHNDEKALLCPMCSYRCFLTSRLDRHITVCHINERQYPCTLCAYHSKTAEQLKRHQETHIGEELKSLKCSMCSYRCTKQRILDAHLLTHSIVRKTYECKICDKKYLNKYNFRNHELTHTDQNFHECSICSTKFASRITLNFHMKLHTGEGRMYCYECNYSSTHKPNFMKHVNKTCEKARHKNINQMQCYQCDYTSNHRSNFTSHVIKCYAKLKKKFKVN